MSNPIVILVKPTKEFKFIPNMLVIKLKQPDIYNKEALAEYELFDSKLDNTGHVSRDWKDTGTVTIPLSALQSASSGGALNIPVINAILAGFNLEVDLEAIAAQQAQSEQV